MSSSLFSKLWPNARTPRKKRRKKKRRKRSAHGTATPGITAIEKLVVEEIEIADVGTLPVGAPRTRKRKSRPAWILATKTVATWVGLALLPVLAALAVRSPWPVDETRTLAVAWEMWLRGDLLVPHLDGAVYSDQPPLFFWLITYGWGVLGVNGWWPRLIPALFGLASLFMTQRLARTLWPDQANVARFAPVLLLAMFFWAFSTTLVGGELLLVFFTLLGALGVAAMWRRRIRHGYLLLGLALGLGPLAGALAIFIYLVPLVVLAPIWVSRSSGWRWGRWYAGVTKAMLLAVVIIVAWAFALYNRIELGYVEGLFSNALPRASVILFSLERPWWWYLAVLPVVALPWSIFPLMWMRLWHTRREKMDTGMTFCLFWVWPAIAVLSLLTIKQPQALLPILPALALSTAYLLLSDELVEYAQDSALSSMALPLIIVGGVLAAVPGLPRVEALPALLWEPRAAYIGVTIAIIGIAVAWLPVSGIKQRIMNIAVGGTALLVIAILGIGWQFDQLYEGKIVGTYLGAVEREQIPVAHVGPYDGQYHFAGRLTAPLEVVDAAGIHQWAMDHPDGVVVTYTNGWQPRAAVLEQPVLEAAYGDQRVRLWEARTILAGGS